MEGGALKELRLAGRLGSDLAESHHKGISSSAISCSGAVVLQFTAASRPTPRPVWSRSFGHQQAFIAAGCCVFDLAQRPAL